MSQYAYGKSANRGECLQPCRREYSIREKRENGAEFELGDGFVMSPKDLCTLPFVEKLFEAGVDALKIEGRSRNAQYVSAATGAYRAARNFWLARRGESGFDEKFAELKKSLMPQLAQNFNRGFSDGFYMGRPAGDWTSGGNRAAAKKLILGRVRNYLPRAGVAEIIMDDNAARIGDTLCVEGNSTGYVEFELKSAQIGGEDAGELRKGQVATIKVPSKMRPNDRVYLISKA